MYGRSTRALEPFLEITSLPVLSTPTSRSLSGRARWTLVAYGFAFVGFVVVAAAPGSTLRVVSTPDVGYPGIWNWVGRFTGLSAASVDVRVVCSLLAIASITAAFLLVVRGAARGWFPVRNLLAVGVAAHVVVLLLPLLYSADVFSYTMYGRVAAVHGYNPYVVTPSAFPHDPAYPLVDPVWRETTPVYGPAFTGLSIGVAEVTGTPTSSLLGFRLIAVAASLATTLLIAWTATSLRPELVAFGVAAFALNPAVLFQTAASGHNDLLVSLAIAAGAALLASGRALVAVGAFTLGMLVKLTAGPAVLVSAGAAVGRLGTRARSWLAVPGVVTALVLLVAGPFVQSADPSLGQLQLSRHEGWIGNGRFLRLALEHLGLGHATTPIRSAIGLALIFGATVLAVRAYRRADDPAEVLATIAWAMLGTLLLLPALLPWYAAWALPLVWVVRDPARHLLLGLSVIGMLSLVVADARLFPEAFQVVARVANHVIAPVVFLVAIWMLVRLTRSLRRGESLAVSRDGSPRPNTKPVSEAAPRETIA